MSTSKMFDIGFAGTRNGMTNPQCVSLKRVLMALMRSNPKTRFRFHHGDCIGADHQAHEIMEMYGGDADLVIHPPDNDTIRAFKKGTHIHELKSYSDCSQDIVNACELLIACPGQHGEKKASGTWDAVKRAREARKTLCLIFPCGNLFEGSML